MAVSGFASLEREQGLLPEQYTVDAWRVEDGLPDNRVTSITQTSDGYLWLGTFNGLVRFDGVRFTVFDTRTPGIESARIASLFSDASGALWIGMEYGDLMRYERGGFTPFGAGQGWRKQQAVCFAKDQNGDVLVGTARGGVLKFKDGQFISLLEDASAEACSKAYFADPMNLAVDSQPNGELWSRTAEGLKVLSQGQWSARLLNEARNPVEISAVAPARKGGVWVCAAGRLLLFRGETSPAVRGDVPRRMEAGCTGMTEDSDGNVWLATWGRGLIRLAPDGSAKTFTTSEKMPAFLRCVFEDREGNIWVGGTGGDGLVRLKPRVFLSCAPEPPLPAYHCNVLAADRQGALWVGTDGHGLVQWRGNQFSAPIGLANLPEGRPVWALASEPAGRLWIGTYYDGLVARDGAVSLQLCVTNGLVNNRVFAVEVARDGAVWIGTDNGVSRYDGNRFENFTTGDGLPEGAVRAIAQDALGDLWFGFADSGLVRRRNGRFELFTRAQGLPHNSIHCLWAEPDGTLWIGTDNGLSRWSEGHFANFRVEDGLPDGKIVAILDDGLGYLWLGSGHGVFRVARSHLESFSRGEISQIECARFLQADGLSSIQCSEGSHSAVRTSDGRLWFATLKGVSVVDPRELRANPMPPPVHIENLLIDGKPQENIGGAAVVTVPPGRHRLEFQYTGLSFSAPDRVRFRHRLAGFDYGWQNVGGQRTASYQGLPPGNYKFHIIAANNDGVWNDEGATLAFVVQPQLWQAAWFRAVVLAAFGGIIFLAVRARIQRLQRQQAAQREFSRGLIASQEQERKRIAAELHDSLGQNLLVIKNRAVMARNPGASAQQELEEIARLATQSLEEVREISQNLRPYQLDRLGLTRALHGLVKKVSASAELRCVADITPLDRVFSPEAEMNLFRIVQEGLNNVLKHSGASEARVAVERNERLLTVSIEDNGRGFEWPPKHNASTHGMGLSGIGERASILNGRLEIASAPGKGTRLMIEVPIPKEKV